MEAGENEVEHRIVWSHCGCGCVLVYFSFFVGYVELN